MKVTVHVAAQTEDLRFKPETTFDDVVRAVDMPLNSTVMCNGGVVQLDDEVRDGDDIRITPTAKNGA